jgi:hypothetical protein
VTNGGGADTPYVFETELRAQRKFIFCITDSDKNCPNAALNHTSNGCREALSETSWTATHEALEVREVENIIPKNIIIDAIEELKSTEIKENFAKIESIINAKEDSWNYLDLKEGTKLRHTFAACKYFWNNAKHHAFCIENSKSDCINQNKCLATSNGNCNCLIAPALGQKISDHVLALIEKQSTHASAARAKTSANIENWLKLGAQIAAWGAALPKLRS